MPIVNISLSKKEKEKKKPTEKQNIFFEEWHR